MVQRHYQQLQTNFYERFLKVLEQQVVVGNAKGTHRVVIADCVEQRSEQRQSVPVLSTSKVLNPLVGEVIM